MKPMCSLVFILTSCVQARWSRHLLSVLFLALQLCSCTTQACEGLELQKTSQIFQSMQQEGFNLGMQCAMTSDPITCALQGAAALEAKYRPFINALSPSCQTLINNALNQRQVPSGGGTNCVGGVCCDSTGCYR